MAAQDGGFFRSSVGIVVATALVVAALILVPLAATGNLGNASDGSSSTTTVTRSSSSLVKPPALPCGKSGCAVVNTAITSPRLMVFYGGSCGGSPAAWYLNVTEGGSSSSFRASYKLTWAFPPGSSTAKPSGRVLMGRAAGATAGESLSGGIMTLKGTNSKHRSVNARGTLTVSLTGSSHAPTLTLTESGLSAAEQQLGFVSPFDIGNKPLVLPVKIVKHFPQC